MKFFLLISVLVHVSFSFSQSNIQPNKTVRENLFEAIRFIEADELEKATLKVLKADSIIAKHNIKLTVFEQNLSRYIELISLFFYQDYNRAIPVSEEILNESELINSNRLIANVYALRGLIFLSQRANDTARKEMLKAIELLKAEDYNFDTDPFNLYSLDEQLIDVYYSYIQNNHIDFRMHKGEKDIISEAEIRKGLDYGIKALEKINKLKTKLNRKNSLFYFLSDFYLILKKPEKAKPIIDSLEILLSSDILNNKNEDYSKLMIALRVSNLYGSYHRQMEEFQQSSAYYERAVDYAHKAREIYAQKSVNNAAQGFNYTRSSLKNSLEETQKNLVKSNRSKNILLVFSLIVFSSIMVVYLFFQRRLLKLQARYNDELKESNFRLKTILSDKLQLEAKIDNIQSAIAADLHDNFGNRLSRILAANEILNELKTKDKIGTPTFWKFLEHLYQNTYHLILDIRDLLWSNDPKNNSLKQIVYRLEGVVEGLTEDKSITISFNASYDKNIRLPQFWNRQILLIFKEAINNAIKYSESAKIKTGLEVYKNTLYMYIEDNGVGFDLAKSKYSGINNMKKRAKSIDCELHIYTEKRRGATVELRGEIKTPENDDYCKV